MIAVRNLTEIESFMAVAHHRSFSKAAAQLGMSKNSVSRFVANLEERLGEKLFRRSTREVFLTGFGEKLLLNCQVFWETLDKFEHQLSRTESNIIGKLKILVNEPFAARFLYPKLKGFRQSHPLVSIDLIVREGDMWNLEAQDIHIIFGFPHVPHITSEWRPRKIGKVKQQMVVSPELLKEFNRPIRVEDLIKIPFITHSARINKSVIELSDGSTIKTLEPAITANSFNHLKELCKNGLGALLIPIELVEKEIEERLLKTILPNLPYKEFELFVFCRAEEYATPRIHAFMDCFKSY